MLQTQSQRISHAVFGEGGLLNAERRSRLLLVSIVLFYVLPALSEGRLIGRAAIVLVLYVALAAAVMELSDRRSLFWLALLLAVISMVLVGLSRYVSLPLLELATRAALAVFFSLVSASLFIYLGQSGSTAKGGLNVSVSLYLLLGMSWFAIYGLLNLIQPGSFAQGGTPLAEPVPWSTFLYFSLTTLTTTGYGDIVAVKPAARMFATLEAAAGVLYVAITVARLVAARQEPKT